MYRNLEELTRAWSSGEINGEQFLILKQDLTAPQAANVAPVAPIAIVAAGAAKSASLSKILALAGLATTVTSGLAYGALVARHRMEAMEEQAQADDAPGNATATQPPDLAAITPSHGASTGAFGALPRPTVRLAMERPAAPPRAEPASAARQQAACSGMVRQFLSLVVDNPACRRHPAAGKIHRS